MCLEVEVPEKLFTGPLWEPAGPAPHGYNWATFRSLGEQTLRYAAALRAEAVYVIRGPPSCLARVAVTQSGPSFGRSLCFLTTGKF